MLGGSRCHTGHDIAFAGVVENRICLSLLLALLPLETCVPVAAVV